MDRNEAQKEKSEQLVAGPREQRYGHPKVNYRRIALIWSAVLGIEVTPTQAVLCELGVKFSRLIQTPDDEDTQVDVHGYIKVLQRLLDPDDLPKEPEAGTIRLRVSQKQPEIYVPPSWEPYEIRWNGNPYVVSGTAAKPWAPANTEVVGIIHPDGSVEGTLDEALAKPVSAVKKVKDLNPEETALLKETGMYWVLLEKEERDAARRNSCGQ